jgi:hypothetical protein
VRPGGARIPRRLRAARKRRIACVLANLWQAGLSTPACCRAVATEDVLLGGLCRFDLLVSHRVSYALREVFVSC